MLDRGPYPLSVYPGQAKIIQLLSLDDSPFVIPAGTVGTSRAIDVLQNLIADLTVAIADNAQGLIRLTVPDTDLVRSYWQKRVFYDVRLAIAGAYKYLPLSELDIQFSPSSWALTPPQTPTPTPTPAPTPAPTPGTGTTGGGATSSPIALYIQDQIWVDSQNRKVRVSIERQADGRELFKLTEIL